MSEAPVAPDGPAQPKPHEEQEPQLKYLPLTGDVPSILRREKVTCLCLSDKILALGTDLGSVHVLDYQGNQVRGVEGY